LLYFAQVSYHYLANFDKNFLPLNPSLASLNQLQLSTDLPHFTLLPQVFVLPKHHQHCVLTAAYHPKPPILLHLLF
jgi:hypothetical protein